MRSLATLLLTGAVAASSAPAAAQLDLRIPPSAAAEAEPALAVTLRRVREANGAQSRREGWWLFGWGVASALAGGLVAATLHDHDDWLAFGLTTAAFGAVDAGLAFPMLDLSGSRRGAVAAGRRGELTDPEAVLEAEITGQRKSGQVFALNLGLDVAYVTAGLLMFFLGRAMDPEEGLLTGSGVAMLSQGAFLLGFDIAAWIHTGRRAAALEQLR